MRISVVMDATAVQAFSDGSPVVPEILLELVDSVAEGENVCAAISSHTIAHTAARFGLSTDIRQLLLMPQVVGVALQARPALAAGRLAQRGVPVDTAIALLLAMKNKAVLLTGAGMSLRKNLAMPGLDDHIIDIEEQENEE